MVCQGWPTGPGRQRFLQETDEPDRLALTDQSTFAIPQETPMATAVIVDAVRTAGGKRFGQLSGWHPADLAAATLPALAERKGLEPALVDDVVMGCVMQVGNQGVNIEIGRAHV